MKVIYVCSPFSADPIKNRMKATLYMDFVRSIGFIPFAPHVYFTEYFDDQDPMERKMGLELAIKIMKICDQLWIFGKPSAGMRAEIKEAIRLNIPIAFCMVR